MTRERSKDNNYHMSQTQTEKTVKGHDRQGTHLEIYCNANT